MIEVDINFMVLLEERLDTLLIVSPRVYSYPEIHNAMKM